VRHSPVGSYFHAKRALGGQCNAAFSGLSVNQESRTARVLVSHGSAQRVALLTDDVEQSDGFPKVVKPLASCNLGSDDSLGVTGAATVKVICIFA